ncbi:T9SS type A sorting domain-containing protein [Flavobacterium sp. LC2016-01]|uniref:T9SS type A sorting domain-containing protein n=1 Tax=Flavobacterium sp. LC2016-01 TaxID=2675876 RepID=UPI0012BAD286|nr:T9SS type A sorting domain-containing protein [Flavobacterium sp. LC2016-01]MTH15477.1 T9SS type A sorting domain-containing protein [Flavobacterium sp. LC2016-01]
MKRKLLVLLFLITLSSFAQNTLIPDPKFEAKLISLGLDTILDGQIPTSNISSITSLDVSSSSIKDLTGIQDFVNLQTLKCAYNELTALDVTKNTKLVTLSCYSNQIKSLDVKQHPFLQILDCYTNQLTTLDVSQNTALTELYCFQNQLTSLNTSKNRQLSKLYCSDNLIGSLNLTNNPFLIFLNCTNNKIKNVLDVTKNTGLMHLFCGNNQITLIDASKMTELRNIDVSSNKLVSLNLKSGKNTLLNRGPNLFANNPTLTCIQVDNVTYSNSNWADAKDATASYAATCPGYTVIPDINFENKLISLGIDSGTPDGIVLTSNISSVTQLDLGVNTTITDLTGIQDFKALQRLYCHGNTGRLGDGGNGKLTTIDVSKNVKLTVLDVSYNQLASLDVTNNPLLISLNCHVNKFTSIDVSKNIKLDNLNVSHNLITELDVSKIPTLRYLSAYYTKLTALDLSSNTALVGVFCNNNDLRSLNLKNGQNGLIAPQSISFKVNPNLTCIQVDNAATSTANWANAKDAAANYSTDCQSTPYTLIPDINFENKLIDLGIDSGTPDGKVLTSNVSSLTILDLGTNTTITDLTGIQDFTALQRLFCHGNTGRAGDGGNGKLTTVDISKNVNLTVLDVSYNQITSLDVTHNPLLISFNCSVNKLTAIDVSKNVKLDNLNISNNLITELNISEIPTLRYLSADYTRLTALDISKNPAIVGLLCNNSDLRSLNLKNGKNGLIAPQSISFKVNPNLTCIQVDNATTSTANWANAKDAAANYSTDCQSTLYTLIPDINFENKLIDLGIDSGTPDGKVLTSNVSSLTILDLGTNTIITDLTGIQDFTALQRLYCHGNTGRLGDGGNGKLTTIDVSKNVNLTVLDVSYNQLANLDVTNNPLLISLNCHVNKFTSIDVSKNIKLDNLNVSHNLITELDISKIPTLRYLSTDYTKLTALDISSNPAMVGLFCNNNDLRSLNLKNGKNELIAPQSISFKVNPNLTCIQVDNAATSTTNWANAKDAAANYSTDCQSATYTLIPDSNFEKKLITLGIDSGTPDGRVLTSSVNKITDLDISYSSITNLTGLEAFTSLTSLKCNGNYTLIALDITKNKALRTLDCNNNYLVTYLDLSQNLDLVSLNCTANKLGTLDVAKNKNLTSLECSSNKLSYLDVSNNTALTKLNVGYNSLTILNVSKNTELTSLTCTSNQIDNLDISTNTKLLELWAGNNQYSTLNVSKNTALNTLVCNTNKLTALDVSGNTALTRLLVYGNKLTNIDASTNTLLSSFDCSLNLITSLNVSKNINLQFLYCNNNKLTTLDVSANTKLGTFDCANNELTYLDVSNNKNLSSLECESNKLKNLNLKNGNNTLFDGYNFDPNLIIYRIDFRDNPDLTCIEVDNVAYSNEKWSSRKDALASFSTDCKNSTIITDPNFENFLITAGIDTDGKNGKVSTSSISSIKTLDISNSNISDLTGLENFTALENLICTGNLITTIDLSSNTQLTYLDISNNPLTSVNISNNKLLKEFYVNGIKVIVRKSISTSNGLKSLDLSNNTLLTKIDVSNNQLTSLDLSKNPDLTDINTSNNNLSELNLQNGHNALLVNLDFKGNTQLSCIKVDDPAYSNANWSNAKDVTAKYTAKCSSLGTADVVFNKATIYPNPSNGDFYIMNASLKKASIYDNSGKLIKVIRLNSENDENHINLKGTPHGVYYIFLENEDAHIVKKIIIQ